MINLARINMTHRDYLETSKWACEVADQYNKSITYILMLIHEGKTQSEDIGHIKEYVTGKLVN